MKHFFSFMTRRTYDSKRQVIRCVLADDPNAVLNGTSVWFYDKVRCIVGKVPDVANASEQVVMDLYDTCEYEPVSFEDKNVRAIFDHFGE